MPDRERLAEQAFAVLRAGLTGSLRREVESALNELVHEYSPSNRENRFVVGGAVEWIIAAAMRATGVPVGNLGHEGLGADVAVYAEALRENVFSLKATFSKSTTYRLVNFLGKSAMPELHPTVFVQPSVGLVLGHAGHPAIADNVVLKSDALVLASRHVKEHAEASPECRIEVEVPVNPKHAATKVASQEVAKAILSKPHHSRLGAMVTDEDDPEAERVRMLMALTSAHDAGNLSDGEFARAKRMLLGPD